MFSPQEKLQVTWQSYDDHLKNLMQTLLISPNYADVTLVCDDKFTVRANKAVLSTCSPVFQSMIDSIDHQHPLIYLRGISEKEINPLMQFMYLGEAAVSQPRIKHFLKVAKDLEIKELCEAGENIDDNNVMIASDDDDVKPVLSINDNQEENQTMNYLSMNITDDSHRSQGNRCYECPYIAENRTEKEKHWRNKHSKEHFGCKLCMFSTKFEQSLKNHMKESHPVTKPSGKFVASKFGILMN